MGKKGGKRTPAGTPVGTPKKGAKPDAGSAAPTPSKATGTPGQRGAKKLDGELNDKRWHIREEVREVRMLTRELTGRIRSLRFFKSVRDMQRLASGDPVSCQACDAKAGAPASGKKRPAGAVWSKSESGVLSTCGHFGCLKCLRANAAAQECGVPGCSCPARFSSVIEASTLGTESVAAGPKSPTKRAKGKAAAGVGTDEALEMGVHGTKMAHLVQLLKDLPKDERVLVFVQFPDLMRQVSEVLEEAGIKTLKLRGSVHQQTGALDLFQKEELGPKDARVLMLMSRDESASGRTSPAPTTPSSCTRCSPSRSTSTRRPRRKPSVASADTDRPSSSRCGGCSCAIQSTRRFTSSAPRRRRRRETRGGTCRPRGEG